MPEAIIFDLDGTLVDSVHFHAEAWVKAFEQYGYHADFDKVRQQIGKGGEYILPEFISQEEIDKDGSKISDYRKQYYQKNLLGQVKPFPKVRELLERVKADGNQIVLASSARPKTVEHYQELLGIKDLINGVTSRGDVEQAKPHPDIFIAALNHFENVSKESVIVVGDSPYDAQAAEKISLSTVGVLCGGFSEDVLKEAGCIAIYKDPADLLDHYEESPLSS
ncbi:HAD hydrolase, IA, variant 1 family protein [Lyngbya aestuarii BL J]|uniref:HAD hydrolase, IA, variant 1 family protein n=1 Tax=Lyngbya aestuarii BL J TaxID=1348334 RepID=U7QK32_9CYAN|nr:HAD family phosphatase [Lyngbya aestuarii]ERT07430.1 HAD hydrolase, IA, variant 1 family protein [Lyngbya aestuarii BL J]